MLENGVLVNHVVNWFSPFKERVTTVTGEYGAFVADTMNSTLTFFESGTKAIEWNQIAAVRGDLEGHSAKYALDQREPLRVEHENFRDAIRAHRAALDPANTATALDPATHTPGIVTLDDALATLRVLDAMLESARDGRTVEL